MSITADQAQESLVAALAARWQQSGLFVQRYETHISRVLVAGPVAYKFKKPVRLDFLDFSSLTARARYCREELRLNRRLAPAIYLDVVPVTGDPGRPVLNGQGTALEYAVKMKSFHQDCLWNRRVAGGLLTPDEIDELAGMLARFHVQADIAPPAADWGSAAVIRAIEDENRRFLLEHLPPATSDGLLEKLQKHDDSVPDEAFARRKRDGYVRECHGDLHLANILTEDGRVQVFDCIEFNDAMRWIDVMSDLAFVRMDLRCQGRPDMATRLLNRYLERTGDFGGLRVLGYYERQRALVRAKVALVQAMQKNGGRADMPTSGAAYLASGAGDPPPRPPRIVILHGFSGSGKSTLAAALAECGEAVVLRSDVERKRLAGMAPAERRPAGHEEALYASRMTRQTYQRLLELAREIAPAGYSAIVDAAFLRRGQREEFRELAARSGIPFVILDVRATEARMRERLHRRQQQGNDASDADVAVMLRQLADHDALGDDERAISVPVEFDAELDRGQLRELCETLVSRIWQ